MSADKPGEIRVRLVDCINVSILVMILEFCTMSLLGETGHMYKGPLCYFL